MIDPLDPETWDRLAPILDSALEARPAERDALLAECCGEDPELRRTVERLVQAAEGEPDSFDRPAVEFAAELLATGPDSATDAAPDAASHRVGNVVAGYRIRGLLGRGGMGEVFRAFHPTLERDVALKVLPAHLGESAEARDRLIHEARAASRIDHPNVQTVYDAGQTDDGRVFLALAYYDGETLAARLARQGPLPIDEVLSLATQLADGLAAAHRHDIVHRDVKPSNLILPESGRLKILDFGVARPAGEPLTREGAAYGTLAYMSPEQTRADTTDRRVDVWAAGVVLYELLTGRRPFQAANDRALIHTIRHDEPPPLHDLRPDAPPALVDVVERCLRKSPEARYVDMHAVRRDLREIVRASGASAPPLAREAERRPWRRRPVPSVIAILALVALASTATWLVRGGIGDAGQDQEGGTADSSEIHPLATSMTVLPFVPVPGDTTTARLGRQLTVTVSSNLNGLGPIRTTEGFVVLATAGQGAHPADDSAAAALARRFATSSYLRGSLIDAGDGLRVDATLYEAATGAEIERLTARGPAGDIAVLTDSITLAVVRAVWRYGDMPAPSLAAITTRSVPALRAYLDGELALAEGKFDTAVAAFESAFRADTVFWYALWRSLYPRSYEGIAQIARVRYDALYEHRATLPEPDRLLLESGRGLPLSERLAARLEITRRFPMYWPGWWSYANDLVHSGPFVGLDLPESRRALERVLELHPTHAPAWEHLFWITVLQRDRQRAAAALSELERAAEAGNLRLDRGLLPTYRALHAALGRGGLSPSEVRRKAAAVESYHGLLPPEFFALDLILFGEFQGQTDVNRALLATRPNARLSAPLAFFTALSLAGRGAWDDAVSMAGASDTTRLITAQSPLAVYGLAVAGAWLGELSPARATELRPGADALSVGGGPYGGPDPGDRSIEAELFWLDGIRAFAERRADGVDSARAGLVDHPAAHAARLARSLDAFRLALVGDSATAGRLLADQEEESAERFAHDRYGSTHPWLTPVNRLSAGRWLAAAGDTARALRLLGWEEANLAERHGLMGPAGLVVGPRASSVRARLYAARNDTARAAFHYATVLDRYDLASEALRPAHHEAAAYLERTFPENR